MEGELGKVYEKLIIEVYSKERSIKGGLVADEKVKSIRAV
jgi:hypothetical protein